MIPLLAALPGDYPPCDMETGVSLAVWGVSILVAFLVGWLIRALFGRRAGAPLPVTPAGDLASLEQIVGAALDRRLGVAGAHGPPGAIPPRERTAPGCPPPSPEPARYIHAPLVTQELAQQSDGIPAPVAERATVPIDPNAPEQQMLRRESGKAGPHDRTRRHPLG